MDRESKLQDAIGELRTERAAHVRKIEELDGLIAALEARISNQKNGSFTATVVLHGNEFSSRGIAEAAEKMIRRANRPLHVKDIAEGLKAGGYQFRSKRPAGSVAPVLYQAAKKKGALLVFMGKNMYSLRGLEEKAST